LKKLIVSCSDQEFIKSAANLWALHENFLYQMNAHGNKMTMSSVKSVHIDSLVQPEKLTYGRFRSKTSKSPDQVFADCTSKLIAYSLGEKSQNNNFTQIQNRDPDRIRIFIYRKSPRSFQLQAKGLGDESSYTLYTLDLINQ